VPQRRFPPPWSVEQQEACFVVRDHQFQCPLLGVKRTSGGGASMSAFDPKRASATLRERAIL